MASKFASFGEKQTLARRSDAGGGRGRVLALDATEGNQPKLWQMPEARGLIRSALRDTRRLLGEVPA